MTVAVLYKWASNPQDAKVASDGKVDWSRAKAALSEYDPVAIEVAKQLADELSTQLFAFSVGDKSGATPLAKKNVMARGIDHAWIAQCEDMHATNHTDVAQALTQLIKAHDDIDIVITGDSSVDEGSKMIPPLVGAYLGWPTISEAQKVTQTEGGWDINQRVPGGHQVLHVDGPVVVSMTTDAVTPRIVGMKDIMQAGKKPVDIADFAALVNSPLTSTLVKVEAPRRIARKLALFSGDNAGTELAQALENDRVLV